MISVESGVFFGHRGEVPEVNLPTWKQVHGTRVVRAGESKHDATPIDCGECDALWTDAPGIAVAVRTADCVPILLRGPEGRVVAAAHAGWRGTLARIAERVVASMQQAGWDPATFTAWIGPSIGPCCYEVSAELADGFEKEFPGWGLTRLPSGSSRPHLDLWRANAKQLEHAGVGRVQVLSICTYCSDPQQFASHRRDQSLDRQISWAVCRSADSSASISG